MALQVIGSQSFEKVSSSLYKGEPLRALEDSSNILQQAVKKGDLFILYSLLQGYNINLESLMQIALENQHLHIIEFLLTQKAALTFKQRNDCLNLAVKNGKVKLLEKLLIGHADLKIIALKQALKFRQIDALKAVAFPIHQMSCSEKTTAVDIAVESSDFEFLLKIIKGDKDLRPVAIKAAAKRGNFSLLHALKSYSFAF